MIKDTWINIPKLTPGILECINHSYLYMALFMLVCLYKLQMTYICTLEINRAMVLLGGTSSM